MNSMTPRMSDMPGLWRRSLIDRADGSRDVTTQVHWLQGQSLFADLRQPRLRSELAHVETLRDLSPQDCLQLALQEGFAGRLLFDGDCFEWRRCIDYQPPAAVADAGWLYWESDILVEKGRDVPYIEHWHRDAAVVDRPPCAIVLRGIEQPDALLLLVGTVFMFARARTAPAAPGQTLAQCVAGAASAREARALVDCEISLGQVGRRGCRIRASTLPYRVGRDLGVAVAGSCITTMDTGPRGEALCRRWEVIESEGDPGADWTAVSGDA